MQVGSEEHKSGRAHDFEMFGGAAGAYAFIGSVLEASTEYSMIATDLRGEIVLGNEGARRLYGYDSDEIVGRHKSVLHVARDARGGLPQAMMDQALERGKWEGTVARVRKDGTAFTARVVMTRRCSEDGEPIGFLLMSGDITDELNKLHELEQAKRSLEAKAEQLETALRYKTEFFSNMSHELRTPLNSLLMLSEVLRNNAGRNLTAEQVQYASVIHDSGSDLLRLLNGILDLARVESGTAIAEISDVALVDIRDALHHEFDHVADDRHLSFSVELPNGLPQFIATDRTLLRQVLAYLLANAFKFTKQGAVTVGISSPTGGWSATHDSLSHARAVIAFAVSDTGIGMTPELHQRIFEDFVQGDGTSARHYGGTGLGLSISAKLVQLLRGEITVTSTVDEGSTFVVYLPTDTNAALIAA